VKASWIAIAMSLGCVYQGRDPGIVIDFPSDSTDGGAHTVPVVLSDASTFDTATSDANDSATDAMETSTWPTPESVTTGDADQLALKGDAFAVYVGAGTMDLKLYEGATTRILESSLSVLARNRLILDDVALSASHRSGVFLYPRSTGARVDVAYGTIPQGVQLAGMSSSYVHYLRASTVPGGQDEVHRRSRAGSTDDLVGCSISTSAIDAKDDYAVVGRPSGTFVMALGPMATGCTSETPGTKLSSTASPIAILLGSARVVMGVDVGDKVSWSAVSLSGGATEPIATGATGSWGSEPTHPIAELDDTLFYVEDAGAENYVVEHAPGKAARRLLPVPPRSVRAVAANATHVYFTTASGVQRVPR
jgi:hypothetical protein